MPHQSRLICWSRVGVARAGLHLIVLASVVGLVSGCIGPGSPSVAASLACTNVQGREGGGADYLDCLRAYRLNPAQFGVSG
jgi:hypothetical protein